MNTKNESQFDITFLNDSSLKRISKENFEHGNVQIRTANLIKPIIGEMSSNKGEPDNKCEEVLRLSRDCLKVVFSPGCDQEFRSVALSFNPAPIKKKKCRLKVRGQSVWRFNRQDKKYSKSLIET